jgi:hypothetical protein
VGRWHAVCAGVRRGEGMTLPIPPSNNTFPHHKLIAYQLALELVKLVARTRISDAQLRQQARKSAASAALKQRRGCGAANAG